MRTVLVLMDTLKRDMLSVYHKDTFVQTPNITAFAKEATVFDNHFIGSAPCMPARRDILCGRLNFLERSWGPIEPFDITLPDVLKQHDIFTHITTDHCHYFRTGGEGYVQQFHTWDFHRGQEGDPWVSCIDDPSNMPTDYYGKVRRQYQWNRTRWPHEEEYPSPKTFQSACDWLDDNKGKDDFFLMVEAFDPHEPFDVPESYMKLYEETHLDKDYFEIPDYARVNVPDDAKDYLQKRYAALVTMTDHWFGKLMQQLKDLDMFEDTLIVMTTDHGYFLGEHDYFGKNFMHLYNELAHLPCIVHFPGNQLSGERIDQLTQNIDIMPTVLAYHGIQRPSSIQGVSWKTLVDEPQTYHKNYAVYGYHAMAVNITDGTYTLFQAPNKENKPCYEYTCLPMTIRKFLGKGIEKEIETGRYFKRTDYPMYRIPVYAPSIIDNVACGLKEVSESQLFDIVKDHEQQNNLYDSHPDIREHMQTLLRHALVELDAPKEQLERINLI